MIKNIITGVVSVIVAVVISMVLVGGNQPDPIGGATGPAFWGTASFIQGFNAGTRDEFKVDNTGALTIAEQTGTTTAYFKATASGSGGRLILEDTDGAGCSEISILNGNVISATITCP